MLAYSGLGAALLFWLAKPNISSANEASTTSTDSLPIIVQSSGGPYEQCMAVD